MKNKSKKHRDTPAGLHPSTEEEKIIADVSMKDDEKRNKYETDESRSDGSANAFEGTEQLRDDE